MEKLDAFDVIIIGAGVAGAATARELSKYKLNVAVLEKNSDVSFGATKGTHAIVHCGFPGNDYTPLRNRGELKGNLMMGQLCSELDVEFTRTGKLLVAFTPNDLELLKNWEIKMKRNGVINAELITDKKRLNEMEPHLSNEIVGALYTPNTAVISPWGLVFGLIENAVDNGVKLFVETEVEKIFINDKDEFVIKTSRGGFKANYIVNAAGIYADEVAGSIGDESFKIFGSRHQRLIMDRKCKNMVRHVVRALNEKGGWGDFVTPTVHGNLMVGEKVELVEKKGSSETTKEGLESVIPKYLRLIPSLSPTNNIKPFSGFVPLAYPTGEYHIRPSLVNSKFINFVLGASGLTASPAMAEYVVQEILPYVGLKLENKEGFNPIRKDIPHFSDMDDEQKSKYISQDSRCGHVVCRCETVSEGEVVEAIKRGAKTRDGVKLRTRAGMGRCQGGFCGPRVLKILSRELGEPVEEITRKGGNSAELLCRTKELQRGGGEDK